jgi:hypothetical protein
MRPQDGVSLLMGGRLLLQFLVDCWVAIEDNRLHYVQSNQNQLRAELYQGAVDAIQQQDLEVNQIGRRIVLPSSFTGGPRHMAQQYQDAMALVRRFGKPDLFVTVTCNPNWPEIRRHVPPGGEASYYPPIVCRVFRLKLKAIIQEIVKKEVFGPVASRVYTIEFQKRGLPHAHILIALQEPFKPVTAADVDKMVSAQLPSPVTERRLFDIITKQMLHVCDGRCKDNDGNCTKGFPKPFQETTVVTNSGFPKYKRPQGGHYITNERISSRFFSLF